MSDSNDELIDAVRELTRTIDDLRTELEANTDGPRLRPRPRPPTPRELLRFTDEIAIPAAIVALETSVRALEGFQRTLKLARTERDVRDRTSTATDAAGDRANALRRTTLSQLDTILTQLQRATADEDAVEDDRVTDLLSEARALRDDLDGRLQRLGDDVDRSAERSDPIRIDIEDGTVDSSDIGDESDTRGDPQSHVDVDAELETLKDRYGEEDSDADSNPDVGADVGSHENRSGEVGETGDTGEASETDGTDETNGDNGSDPTRDDSPGAGDDTGEDS
ncbi:DUF7547 family protein [Natronorubrum daqingense]|uniref:Uncharacterized protein n=1 Tax=Natronorubrum daqingense TaxID=588898 RepID=A0A1N6XJ31_9EURY|nr:hypothetical protein [Natronorubrum daqingense]APX95940.1 hypothetical protein BB347_04525 [Natronorubrum daqingense]SIR02251.1 hypothetical protein SAMN05421809_0128 [Natronorubrum daqingense]